MPLALTNERPYLNNKPKQSEQHVAHQQNIKTVQHYYYSTRSTTACQSKQSRSAQHVPTITVAMLAGTHRYLDGHFNVIPTMTETRTCISPNASPHPNSPHLMPPHLTTPHCISLHLIASHLISLHCTPSHRISPHLPSPHLFTESTLTTHTSSVTNPAPDMED